VFAAGAFATGKIENLRVLCPRHFISDVEALKADPRISAARPVFQIVRSS